MPAPPLGDNSMAMKTESSGNAKGSCPAIPWGCIQRQPQGAEPIPLNNLFSGKEPDNSQQAQITELLMQLSKEIRLVVKENTESQRRTLDEHSRGMQAQQDLMFSKIELLNTNVSSLGSQLSQEQRALQVSSIPAGKQSESSSSKQEDINEAGQSEKQSGELKALNPEESEVKQKQTPAPKSEEKQSKVDQASQIVDVEEEEPDLRPLGEKIVSSDIFEIIFSVLIILNTVNMCVEAEYRGGGNGYKIGIAGASPTTSTADTAFAVIEITFGIIFTFEVLLKLAVLRCRFWHSGWNVFDLGIIGIAWFDTVADVDLPINPMLLRLVRLVRLVRLLRTLSAYPIFDDLFLMVKGIKASTPVLVWVIVLVFPMMASCALGMNYTIANFINDETKDIKLRKECYMYFGTFLKSMVSMFEVTFGNWVIICRLMYHNVDEKYALFFIFYKLIMGVAVLRIIYAVFMHVTFACAASDEESIIAKKAREEKKYASRMEELFTMFDSDCSGDLTRDQFLTGVNDKRANAFLSALGIDIHDAELAFDLTDNGDGRVDPKEFIHGFSRLKGNARSLDIMALTRLTEEVARKLDKALVHFHERPSPHAPTMQAGIVNDIRKEHSHHSLHKEFTQ